MKIWLRGSLASASSRLSTHSSAIRSRAVVVVRADVRQHDLRKPVPGRLRAGVQPVRARRHHDGLQEHAVVEQAAAAHDAVDGEHQPHRRIEEAEVALVLRMHARLVGLADAQGAIQAPAAGTSPVDVGADPFLRVVVVGLAVFGRQRRISRQGIVGGADLVHQRVARGTLQDVHLPRLGVGAAGRARGHAQDARDRLARHGRGQEGARGEAAFDSGLDACRVAHHGVDLGHQGFRGIHCRLSRTCWKLGGSGTGRRVSRSTYTCTKWPCAALSGSPSANRPTS